MPEPAFPSEFRHPDEVYRDVRTEDAPSRVAEERTDSAEDDAGVRVADVATSLRKAEERLAGMKEAANAVAPKEFKKLATLGDVVAARKVDAGDTGGVVVTPVAPPVQPPAPASAPAVPTTAEKLRRISQKKRDSKAGKKEAAKAQ